MNDIEKLSPDVKKALTLQLKQERSREAHRLWLEQRAVQLGVSVDQVRTLNPLVPVNTLPDVGDDQDSLLARDQWPVGITFTVSPWEDMDLEGEFDLYFEIDGVADTRPPGLTVLANFAPFDHTVDIGDAVTDHGVHSVRWWTKGGDSGNVQEGPPMEFFIDVLNPNLQQEPDPILLPNDLPNGDITQDYLDQHGGVTFTLPPFADPRVGDKYSLFINDVEILADLDAVAPYDVVVDKSVFATLPEGYMTLTYHIIDRCGNRTDRSAPEKVILVKLPAPVVRAPIVPEGVLITLADARDGVEVLHDYDTAIQDDWNTIDWHGTEYDSYRLPVVSLLVPFKDIKSHGDFYKATITHQINRNGKVYPAPPTIVDVDLTFVGPENPDEPELINPDLDPLTLESSTQLVNEIAPPDKNNDATITLPLYSPVNVGEVVEVFYGAQSVRAVTLTQTEIDADEVSVTLTWAMIDAVGNGTIDAYYLIYAASKPENAQQSPVTPILVTVHNLPALPVLDFPDRDVSKNIINCNNEPWINGVNPVSYTHLTLPTILLV